MSVYARACVYVYYVSYVSISSIYLLTSITSIIIVIIISHTPSPYIHLLSIRTHLTTAWLVWKVSLRVSCLLSKRMSVGYVKKIHPRIWANIPVMFVSYKPWGGQDKGVSHSTVHLTRASSIKDQIVFKGKLHRLHFYFQTTLAPQKIIAFTLNAYKLVCIDCRQVGCTKE